ncbi:cyanide-forming glycine dehydrogenase subunit HcnA [Pseudomonas xanthosomatis]|uniref:cyanide-forming glycine dehydrogenase subunit HcnA n=1 Tax=Pseudomonas xanthosomatis TaxID=2842356 RepID=UPI001C3DC23A|nr:cyanide-forming glycine dehydrogenase subunit HcnA [Pseudomonas xanthosomatis]QXH46738.1 cyanide-forming glycine dehydrogenase subunit HcnA [Pseudomonas xanthosomatis]
MKTMKRIRDIQPLEHPDVTLQLNGQPVVAAAGETVLSVLNAVGLRQVARNDHGQASGAFCGMGVCHCCLVQIDGRAKRRACQTVVRPGMQVVTQVNPVHGEGRP